MRRLSHTITALSIGLLLVCFLLLSPVLAIPDLTLEENETVTIQSVEVYPTPEGSVIEIQADKKLAFVTYTLKNPDRFVIDWLQPEVESSIQDEQLFEGGMVQNWSLFRLQEPEHWDYVDRLSFELEQPAEHLIETEDNKLKIRIRPKRLQASLGLPVHSGLKEGPFSLDQVLRPLTAPPGGSGAVNWDLNQILQFGLSRNRPLRISIEEVEFAQMKVQEAKRTLYPAATLRTSWTDGTASEVDFREFSTGLQLEQPLYHSGRLRETYQQSLVNLQVSEKRQAKVKADAAYDITEAYYQWVGSKSSLTAQEDLVEEAENFLKNTQARFDEGLLTRLDLLNVESQVNQAKFQRANAENDALLAHLNFMRSLRLEREAPVEVADSLPPLTIRDITLDEVLLMAAQYRPDIQVNSLLVQFHEHEERISKKQGELKVDLSGFIGTSASAFETEDLDAKEDYFVGLRASKSWGGSETTFSVTDTHTSPRLGQTTRTDSIVYTGEVNILNQLEGVSDVKRAQINLNKARNDLEKTKAEVRKETHESFLSYEKARVQLDYTQQKIQFRQEQVKILKAQASLNEALPSQVLESVMRLTDERVGQVQAVTNYYVALAKLNKSIGLVGFYQS